MMIECDTRPGRGTMDDSHEQSWTLRLVRAVLLAAAVVFAPDFATGEIIVDDFVDPVEILLPEMEDVTVTTEGVGDLTALRLVFVSELRTDPIGRIDVDVTKHSHLTARIDGQIPDTPQTNPLLSFGTAYDFGGPTDLTEHGVNDALFIDMTVFRGAGIPPALSVLVRDANDVFAAIVSGFRLPSDSPYTLTIPFSSFGVRGSGVGLADFSTVDLFEVRVRLLQGASNPDVNWFVQIDRIRVGRVVPEPATWRLAFLAALFPAAVAIRRQQPQYPF